jgi:hypothetical protein
MKPKVLYDDFIHLNPDIAQEYTYDELIGLNSITFKLEYIGLFKGKKVFAEVNDLKGFFKVLILEMDGKLVTQRSLTIDANEDFTGSLKICLISEKELLFKLKIFVHGVVNLPKLQEKARI